MTFIERLQKKWAEKKFVCVNLDPDITKIPEAIKKDVSVEEAIVSFNTSIIDATGDLVCAYKPNSAFYEAYGEEGLRALKRTSSHINERYPDVPTILDAKRADIGNTNEMYVKSIFDDMGFGAVTVHPYLGREALEPFLDRKDKGIFILVKTSSPGSDEFQNMNVNGEKLYEHVARNVAEEWNRNGNCGVVVGAPYPEELAHVRKIVNDMPILIPGVGAQGGDAKESFTRGKNKEGTGVLIAAGRSIIYASHGADFAEAARKEVEKLSADIAEV